MVHINEEKGLLVLGVWLVSIYLPTYLRTYLPSLTIIHPQTAGKANKIMKILQQNPADAEAEEAWNAFSPYSLLPKDKAYW